MKARLLYSESVVVSFVHLPPCITDATNVAIRKMSVYAVTTRVIVSMVKTVN